MGQREEITDVITPEGYAKLKKGDYLRFEKATLKITAKRQGRIWAEHVTTPVDAEIGMSHYGHNVDVSQPDAVPFCQDCGVYIDKISTEEGDQAAYERKTNRAYRRERGARPKVTGDELRERANKKNLDEIQEGEVIE